MKNKPIFKGLKKRKRKILTEILADMPIEITSPEAKVPDVLVQKIKDRCGPCFSISPVGLGEYVITRIRENGMFYLYDETRKAVTYAEPHEDLTKYYFFRIE